MAKKNKKEKHVSKGDKRLTGRIQNYFKRKPSRQLSRKQIQKRFINEADKEAINEALDALQEKGDIELLKNNKFRAVASQKEESKVVEGVVDMTASGNAYIISESTKHDIYINRKRMHTALHGDKVKVAIYQSNRKRRPEGEITDILERAHDVFIGIIETSEQFAFLNIEDHKIPFDIFIPLEKLYGANQGEKAAARITQWPTREDNPQGEIVRKLGEPGQNNVEIESILMQNGFHLEFPEEVLNEADKIKDVIPQEEIDRRKDVRNVPTFTIDPEDAKDFDDALSIRQIKSGLWEVGVHIADVSYYIAPGSELDKEAYERATSVYLVDRVLPMFPERISNRICSLRPDEDNLAFSVFFEMDDEGKVHNFEIGKAIIRSDKRFAYEDAQQMLETGEGPFAAELKKLNEFAHILRKERFANGAINFETLEFKFQLDDNYHPIDVFVKERKDAHMLIEDFMLLANRYVAGYVAKLRKQRQPIPFVYRVHDVPDPERVQVFADFAKKFGHEMKYDNPRQVAESLNILMDRVKGREEENILEQLAIRTMSKAYYTTQNIGHYGLAFDKYSHFTSPIRRYPDLMVHRIVEDCIHHHRPAHQKSELEEYCQHVSTQEVSAERSERESIKFKQVEYMRDRLGDVFEGIIAGVVSSGFFVELEANHCEGLVLKDALPEDDLVYDEENLQHISQTTQKRYRLGDHVTVQVVDTNLARKSVYFEVVEKEK